jgi:large subunit ribosomal protein LP0
MVGVWVPKVAKVRKQEFRTKLYALLGQYNKMFIVKADHVGSKQMQNIRIALRGKGVVCMGKNTLMRSVIRQYCEDTGDNKWLSLCPEGSDKKGPNPEKNLVQLNIGFVFIKEDFADVRDVILENTRPAPAKSGVVAMCDVVIPPGPTGADPSKTAYFQAMSIPTKIVRGQIEITGYVNIIKKGERVTAGQADVCQQVGLCPFVYGLLVSKVYNDGALFDPAVLELTDDALKGRFASALGNVAALSLELGIPTFAAMPHYLSGAFRHVLALLIGAGADYSAGEKADAVLKAAK